MEITPFLVSTANKLLFVTDRIVTELLTGWFYGITWDTDKIYLMNRQFPNIFIWTGEKQIENCDRVPFLNRIDDTHQLLWYDGVLYVTHTGRNRIEVWDGQKDRIIEWTDHPGEGTEHINSIWYDAGRFYVCEHRYGKEPARIRVFNRDFILFDTIEFFGLDNSHTCGIHNVYIENGQLYTLSVNKLIAKNLKTNQIRQYDIRSHKDIGYLRGLARDDKYFYIGESAVSVREDRRKGDSKVIILDNELKIIDTINLVGTGQLHDIRLLSNDKSHNGLDCPMVWKNGNKTKNWYRL